jgi:hypothetical protein
MRGGSLPPALLFAALGMALSFAPWRAIAVAAVLALVAAIGASFIRVATSWEDPIFLGCWIGVAVAAASVHIPGGVRSAWALILALNSGLWAGAVIAAAGQPIDLAISAPAMLVCVPGAWLVATGRGIAVKVASSWLLAVGVLALCLQLAPTTPGYKPDHMD